LIDAYVDGVTVASAFHWFDAERALAEIHRVLKPGGGLALIWNARDERDVLQREISKLVDPLRGDVPGRKEHKWLELLADSGLFERCGRSLFEHEQIVDAQGLVERVLSISFVATAPADVRRDVEARLRELVRERDEPVRLSYMTELYVGFAS
jgi:SAM-dependent methyltransferase